MTDDIVEAQIELGLIKSDDVQYYEAGLCASQGWPTVHAVRYNGNREQVWRQCSLGPGWLKWRKARRMAKQFARRTTSNRAYVNRT